MYVIFIYKNMKYINLQQKSFSKKYKTSDTGELNRKYYLEINPVTTHIQNNLPT